MSEVHYRLAKSSDVAAIAALHADSWRRSYRGMFPDAYLDNDLDADRAAVWQQRFDTTLEQPVTVTILAELNGELVGFAHSIVAEDPEWGTLLDNLHVRHGTKRLGVGTRLMAETATWLEARGDASGLYLWVLEGNAPASSSTMPSVVASQAAASRTRAARPRRSSGIGGRSSTSSPAICRRSDSRSASSARAHYNGVT